MEPAKPVELLRGKPLADQQNVIEITHPLYLIVGEKSTSPCDHATFRRFQLWVVEVLTDGRIDNYREGNVSIDHWDERAGNQYPYLLNPCECGTYLPIEVDPNPMFSSSVGLLVELQQLDQATTDIPANFRALVDAMTEMAERSIDTNVPLEVR